MIEALKSEKIVDLVGGRFKLCTLIQKRLVQLLEGARPLVDRDGRSDLELVVEEILQGKVGLSDQTGELVAPSAEALQAIGLELPETLPALEASPSADEIL